MSTSALSRRTLGTTTRDHSDRWLEAAPFCALLRHLMAVGGVSAADLGALTGLSGHLLHHLAHGRRGRAVRRISPHVGSILMQLRPTQVMALRSVSVPAGLARAKVARLEEAGWTEAGVMRAIGATPTERRAIAQLGGSCSQLLLVRLRALCRDLDADSALDVDADQIREAA